LYLHSYKKKFFVINSGTHPGIVVSLTSAVSWQCSHFVAGRATAQVCPVIRTQNQSGFSTSNKSVIDVTYAGPQKNYFK